MSQPADKIHVKVEYYNGNDEGDVGYPYYVATCEEIAAVTDARTLDELFKSIRDMIAIHLEDEDTVATYNLIPEPAMIIDLAYMTR
jgi:predicted RNase H-like HicB family nuclease